MQKYNYITGLTNTIKLNEYIKQILAFTSYNCTNKFSCVLILILCMIYKRYWLFCERKGPMLVLQHCLYTFDMLLNMRFSCFRMLLLVYSLKLDIIKFKKGN